MSLTTSHGSSSPLLGFGDYSHLPIASAASAGSQHFSGAGTVARVLDPTSGRLTELLNSGAARNLSEAIHQLNPSEQSALRTRWGTALDEMLSLAHEHDATIFHHGLLEVGHRLEDADQVELAGAVYSAITANPSPLGGEGARRADEGIAPAGILARAQARLNAMNGVGDWRARLAFNLERLPGNATRADMLFAIGGAGLVFRGVRLAATARWASSFESAFALNAAATSSAFLAETVAFTGFGRLAGSVAGHHYDWSAEGTFNEWAGGAAMLLGLKAMGGIFGNLSNRWAAGETAFARLTRAVAPQAGMFAGILTGNRLAELGGFHPERHGDTWFLDGLTTLLEFNVVGRLQRSASGPGLANLEGRMEAYTQAMAAGRPRVAERLREFMSTMGVEPQFVTAEGIRISASEIHSGNDSKNPLTQNAVFSVRHDGGEGGGSDGEAALDSGVHLIPPRESQRVVSLDTAADAEAISLASEGPGVMKELEASGPRINPGAERPWLFITGGSSGIGQSLVLLAQARGYEILFGGSRAFGDLPSALRQLGVQNYLQVDVASYPQVMEFRDVAMGRYLERPAPMLVVASAGISARGSEAEVKRMWEVNVAGTNYLAETFRSGLRMDPSNRFAAFGSIVAAEGIAVKGDEAYQGTKLAIQQAVHDIARAEIEGFTVAPGAVDTPMTRKELVFGFLIQNLMIDALRPDSPLHGRMREYFGPTRLAEMTPADLFRSFLGESLTSAAASSGERGFNYSKIDNRLGRDPMLGERTQLVLASEMSKSPEVMDTIAHILTRFDAVIGPDLVAQRTLDQFESGSIPSNRLLRVYSQDGQDLILRLLGAPAKPGESSALPPRAVTVPPPPVVPAVPEAAPTPLSEVAVAAEGVSTPAAPVVEVVAASEPPVNPVTGSDKPTAQTGLSSIGVRRSGEGWAQDVVVTPKEAQYYSIATGNLRALGLNLLPAGLSFSKNLRGTVEGLGEAMRRAPRPTVIHASEEIDYLQPWRPDLPVTLTNSSRSKGKEGAPQTVTAQREIRDHDGELLVSGKSLLFVGPDFSEVRPVALSAEALQKLPVSPVLEIPVTSELAETFAEASGDVNPVHMSEAGARELGLPGRILHGMATFNFAERALYEFLGSEGPSGPYRLKAAFKSMAMTEAPDGSREGDVLRFFAQGSREKAQVTVINQRNELVMTLDFKPLPSPEVRSPSLDPTTLPQQRNRYGRFEVDVDVAAGYRLVQKAAAAMAPHLPRLREALGARVHQPWFIAGMSDGMGFHYATALMAAGVRHLVGGYYEPDALLKAGSEVHLARVARAEGLKVFAGELGANLEVFYENLVLSEWRNKDDEKRPLPNPEIRYHPLPERVRLGLVAAQRRAWSPDLNFANSIAFAQHISPAPGVERLTELPTLDLEGNVVLSDMKPYDEARYQQGTIDPMGRNHEALLRNLGIFFGRKSTSYFFTWAGGSQNTHILRGVYGGGALGVAKEIGETATLRYHLESQADEFARGVHKIVRFPDFPTFALFGIPGGGGMGMIARHVLEGHGRYMDVPDLAPLSLIAALGGENNLRNPASQIELDVPESYHIGEIRDDLAEFHRRVREHRSTHPERWVVKKMGMMSTPAMTPEDSRAILLGSAVEWRREHPEMEGQPIPREVWEQLRRGPNRPLVSEDYRAHIPNAWD